MAHPETDWQSALARLDQGLALAPAERGAWLEALGREHPGAARLLSRLLEAHERVNEENLLQGLPQLLTMPRAVLQDPGRPGLHIGPFQLVELLGRGGMGSVWRARYADGRLQREVAVKLPSRSPDPAAMSLLRERLIRERNFLARLEHPHIARVYDAGLSDDGQPFLAMEYVQGEAIDRYADAARLTVTERIRLFLQVLDAVAFAHQQLVLHRDLKPGNVLVTGQGQVRLLDFGIASLLPGQDDAHIPTHLVGDENDAAGPVAARDRGSALEVSPRASAHTGPTGMGGPAYTLSYAAPEQVTGEACSTSTDVYALGVMLYQLLTGWSPYEPCGPLRSDMVDAVCHRIPLPASGRDIDDARAIDRRSTPTALRRALAGDLDIVIGKALAKKPSERYATVDAMAADLRRLLARQPIEARAGGLAYRMGRFISRHPLGVTAGATGVLMLSIATGVAIHQARVSQRMETVALREAEQALASQRFFSHLLSTADPEFGKGAQPGFQRGLDGALASAEAEFSQMPEALARVLKQLGEIYIRLDVPDKNLQVQRKRVALLASLPAAAVDERVDAQIELARALPFSADPAERSRDLDEAHQALRMADELHASAGQVVNALCLLVDRYTVRGDAAVAVNFAEQAVRKAEAAQPALKVERSLAYAELGYSAARLGRFEQALAALRRSLDLDRAGEGRGLLEQVHTRTVLADVEFDAGHYAASRTEALATLDFATHALGAMEGTLLPLRVRAVLATLALGEVQGAHALAYRLLLDDMRSQDPFRAARASYALGVASLARRSFDEAWSALSAARQGLAVSPIWTVRLQTDIAEWLLLKNRPEEAFAMLEEALKGIDDDRQLSRDTYARAFERAGVASARLGRLEDARRLFAQSCSGRRRLLTLSHPDRIRCESYLLMLSPETRSEDLIPEMGEKLQLLRQQQLEGSALARSLSAAMAWAHSHQPVAKHLMSFPLLS